jgi:hypothetical protein
MLMRTQTVAVAACIAGLAAGQAAAQDPYAVYNQARAYHHFLTSPYRTRTYSGTIPGFVQNFATPLGYGTAWRTPGYQYQRISPRGFEGYLLPGQQGVTVVRPAGLFVPPPVLYPLPGGIPR